METMPDHPEIYRSQAEQYDTLVSNEDYQNNLLPALQKLTSFNNKTVVEFGAGTGRVTCLLAPLVRSIGLTEMAFRESTLLQLGMQYQRMTEYHRRRPTA